MKRNIQNKLFVLICVLSVHSFFAQKKDENLGTEVVNVVKSYTPTISDAFKVKDTPKMDNEETAKKENIQYSIYSFPVASTFVPNKGRAANVEKSPEEKLFDNYLTIGAGNYGTALTELYVSKNINNSDYFGGAIRHISSQGGIKNVVLDDKFFDTGIDLTYGSKGDRLSWDTNLGYKHQIYNWYGIFPGLIDEVSINSIQEQQTYQTLEAGGKIQVANGFFKKMPIQYNRFWDAFGSIENQVAAKPYFEFELGSQKVNTLLDVNYLKGSFKNNYYHVSIINYGFFNVGLFPSIKIQKEDLSVDVGVGMVYSNSQNAENKFYVYPKIKGTYKVIQDLMDLYGGIEGGLQQKSYQNFVQQNYFVSPALSIIPTDKRYEICAGLKGKITNTVSYNIKGAYQKENNKALFKSKTYEGEISDGFAYGNSFGVIYNDVKTASLFGELKADLTKNISFGINGMFNSYSMSPKIEKAWNLPKVKFSSSLDITITPKWNAGINAYYIDERNDLFSRAGLELYPDVPITLNSYLDLNANVGYKHNERWSFYLKGNNILNKDYQRWMNYPAQGLQILVGASYKFDF